MTGSPGKRKSSARRRLARSAPQATPATAAQAAAPSDPIERLVQVGLRLNEALGADELHALLINEAAGSEWSYAAVPSTSFVDRYDPDYSHYFSFDLTSSLGPNGYTPLP